MKDVSLAIKAGERLAVVGLNGAGKSTFVKLLTRLYEPESGRILLNGTDIRTYDKQAYYGLFSIVFQDIRLFAFSVAENVAMREHCIRMRRCWYWMSLRRRSMLWPRKDSIGNLMRSSALKQPFTSPIVFRVLAFAIVSRCLTRVTL
ncbi:MAG TPA: ATP-binding cassette domain-containing protein [Firmicutes bacterium]|nr:ATP-binding cassette domain-containing protein [Bacillota bacterium]